MMFASWQTSGPGEPEPPIPGAGSTSGEGTTPQPSSERPGASMPLPSISLPKGGGAVRDIGEKFSVNSASGTGSTSVPIYTSASRSGFGPALSLSYDSGSGNGPFGFGWQLSLPSISRKTDKGLPLYQDEEESDVFMLAGAEDLVPALQFESGEWIRKLPEVLEEKGKWYQVKHYRPRVEGAFTRIEKWTELHSGESHWRTISKENVTILFGEGSDSRISDPSASSDAPRTFRWLVSESYDDKGNVFSCKYKTENSEGVDTNAAHEINRTEKSRSSQRYLKRIRYGNRVSRVGQPECTNPDWMFEVVFDYGEHEDDAPGPEEVRPWAIRPDAFSTYRSCFEVRTYRLCRRILMFHHFPKEPAIGSNCLVSSSEISYHEAPEESFNEGNQIASFISAITQRAYQRQGEGYLQKALPPLEFKYSQPIVSDKVYDLDPSAIENLPSGVDEGVYRWLDLDGEGVSGILTQQGGAHFYKPNLGDGKFGSMEALTLSPALASQENAQDHWMDLAGDGHMDLVKLGGSTPGFYRRLWTPGGGWQEFQPFKDLPNILSTTTNVQYLDLTGDGLTDILIANDDVFIWHASLGEVGFGSAEYSRTALDEEKGPRLLVSDATEALYVADMSGDGLNDLVRIRNGDICYWPNLGYGRFGKKVAMGNAPWLDFENVFQQSRLRLFDIDGSGTTDLIYLSGDGAYYYQNQSGNSWTHGHQIRSFPRLDSMSQVQVVDLLGHGTGCLVWSSKLPADYGSRIRYVDLMGSQKPHLLISQVNNLGLETHIHYSSSTHFYLQDKATGRPWVTRLAFPVHVVDRVETFDYIGKNHFVTHYAYHDGFFDGVEREFHGFGMVEQMDTEEFESLNQSNKFPDASNIDAAWNVPLVLTKTWFHTGAYFEGAKISRHNESEYYVEPGLTVTEFEAMLLEDTILPRSVRYGGNYIPHTLARGEVREACRALRGQQLRQEVYGLDGSGAEQRPYQVTEANFIIDMFQPRGTNRYAAYFVHPLETIDFHYERRLYSIKGRELADPRVSHSLNLATDQFGNVLESVSIAYGRRHDDPSSHLTSNDREAQHRAEMTYVKSLYTNPIFGPTAYRTPLLAENCTYQLFKASPLVEACCFTTLYKTSDLRRIIELSSDGHHDIPYSDFEGKGAIDKHPYRRLVERQRTIYRRNDLTGPLPLGRLESLALSYEGYHMVLSFEFSKQMYVDSGKFSNGQGLDEVMTGLGYVHSEGDQDWWIPSGREFLSLSSEDTPFEELQYARRHYFLPLRFRDPFFSATNKSEWFISYDSYDLLAFETKDPLGNLVTVGERNNDPNLPPTVPGHDYRLLVPVLVMDPNRNRAAIAYDVLGNVVGSALMGKPGEEDGDTLEGFEANLSESVIERHFASPFESTVDLLRGATARFVYNIYAFQRARTASGQHPTGMSTISRVTHQSELAEGQQTDIMLNFSYFDGFGRTIQSKTHAGPGPLLPEDPTDGQASVPHRFVCSGWMILNNKGNPVRKYEPFYTDTQAFEFDVRFGVTSTLFYDPIQRVVATLFPDETWSKTVFDSWGEETWDANDTVLQNPTGDPDVGDFFRRLSPTETFATWYDRRISGALGSEEQAAAVKTAAHADTPTRSFLDVLGHKFLVIEHNKEYSGETVSNEYVREFTLYDVEGNKRHIIDANERKICIYDYDMSKAKIHQSSMEAGELWMLHDVSRNVAFGWDSRMQRFRTVYDVLRRPIEVFLSIAGESETIVEKNVYGEILENPEQKNCRQHVIKIFDQAGMVFSDAYDFKANILRTQRQFAQEYKSNLDWSHEVQLDSATFSNHMSYDALNRKVKVTTPDRSITHYLYNDVGTVRSVRLRLHGAAEESLIAKDIQYNARGQRHSIEYGNNTKRVNNYDDLTFRLKSIITHRHRQSVSEDQDPPAPAAEPKLQHLHYTYDPIGNVVHIQDNVQQRIFFRNKCVDPSSDYTYDALYRLIESSGREHLGQTGKSYSGHGEHARDGNAMARYTERYRYDLTGNLLHLQHQSADPTHGSWTRHFTYQEPSQIEPEKVSNRLSQMTLGKNIEEFSYAGETGLAGNITFMSRLPVLGWDYKNQLSMSARQAVDTSSTPETTYYRYDARGQRVRKVTETHAKDGEAPTVRKERVYIGSFEEFRKYSNDAAITLERQTLRPEDGEDCFLVVETRTAGQDKGPKQVFRYQLGDHLKSVAIELSSDAEIITYEEYSAYGDTSYQASHGEVEAPKRYRYSGKEKDEESGLYYYGARYYLPHICRWINCDPGGLKDGPNLYGFVKCNPVSKTDPNGAEASWWNRATGAVKVIGGVLEIAAGAGGIAAPTGITQVLGAVALVHGADSTWAGLKEVWTGEEQKTYTEQTVTKAAEAAGASHEKAETIGMVADIGIGIVSEAGIALTKGGALAKIGGGLRRVGSALKEAAVGTKKAAAEKGTELVGKIASHAGGVLDDAGRALFGEARQVTAALGPQMDSLLMMAGKAEKAGEKAVSEGSRIAAKAKATERAVEAVKKTKGIPLDAEEETHLHHWVVQQLRDKLSRVKGLDIDELAGKIGKTLHGVLHGYWKEITGMEMKWNQAWLEWYAEQKGKEITKEMVMTQLKKMMEDFGVAKYWGKWVSYK